MVRLTAQGNLLPARQSTDDHTVVSQFTVPTGPVLLIYAFCSQSMLCYSGIYCIVVRLCILLTTNTDEFNAF